MQNAHKMLLDKTLANSELKNKRRELKITKEYSGR